MILFQYGKTLSGSDYDITVGRLQRTGKDFQEGGLAGAVGTDKAVTVAFREFNINIFKKRLFPRRRVTLLALIMFDSSSIKRGGHN